MPIKFTAATKHGRERFLPNISFGFEDPLAEDYFVATGWAETTTDEPAFTYPAGTATIDPLTIHGAGSPLAGQYVLPDAAAEALAITHPEE